MDEPLDPSIKADGADIVLKNVLERSKSPYVREHMHNPVAWQEWGPEAIELAKKSNRLLFVSIGYAACHWCHVMNRESFQSAQIAAFLNAHFVPIKVDREERPDVDSVYMNYVQATTGHGGWPLNVFLTPALEPVFGGTYWPGPGSTVSGGSHAGFLGILERIEEAWRTQRQRCLDSAQAITEQLREFAQEGTLGGMKAGHEDGEALELDLLEEAYSHYASRYDKLYGGFGNAPKFPTPTILSFLLRLGQHPETVRDIVGEAECEYAKEMALMTLRKMVRGGIHDQIGQGFARYSVTRDWSLPHFEKMLYDQAQLLPLYLDAFLIAGDAEMLGAVYDISAYLTSPPLAAPNGGFYTAEDADSFASAADTEKKEGAFYVWTLKEFQSILGDRDAQVCAQFWNVKENGNVSREYDAHDELINQNVLEIASTPELLSKDHGLSKEEVVSILKTSRAKLLAYRNEHRPRPALDDKIVVSCNGLAIGALARTASVLEEIDPAKAKECLDAARKAVHFIKTELFDPKSGTLRRIWRDGPGDTPAFADDYAFLIAGLIDLYEATFDDSHLAFADTLQSTQIRLFWDETSPVDDTAASPSSFSQSHTNDSNHHSPPLGTGFFTTPSPEHTLLPAPPLLRLKPGMDAAEPSANAVSASNLFRLASLLGDPRDGPIVPPSAAEPSPSPSSTSKSTSPTTESNQPPEHPRPSDSEPKSEPQPELQPEPQSAPSKPQPLNYKTYAHATAAAFSAEATQHPFLFSTLLSSAGVMSALGVRGTVLVSHPPPASNSTSTSAHTTATADNQTEPTTDSLAPTLRRLRARVAPCETVARIVLGPEPHTAPAGDGTPAASGVRSAWLKARNPLLGALDAVGGGRARVLVCEGGLCREEEGV